MVFKNSDSVLWRYSPLIWLTVTHTIPRPPPFRSGYRALVGVQHFYHPYIRRSSKNWVLSNLPTELSKWSTQRGGPGHLPIPVAGIAGNAVVQVPVSQCLLLVENKLLQFHLHLGACYSTWEEYQSEEEGSSMEQGVQGTRQKQWAPSAGLSQD